MASAVKMHDVEDAKAFVCAMIDRRLVLREDQREDLVAEGLAIMVRLAADYQPGRNGLDPGRSSFAGYASVYLRKQLGEAFRRMSEQPEPVSLDSTESGFDPTDTLNPTTGEQRRWFEDGDLLEDGPSERRVYFTVLEELREAGVKAMAGHQRALRCARIVWLHERGYERRWQAALALGMSERTVEADAALMHTALTSSHDIDTSEPVRLRPGDARLRVPPVEQLLRPKTLSDKLRHNGLLAHIRK